MIPSARGWLIGGAIALAVVGAATGGAQSAAESYIVACERAWSASLVTGDTEAVYRCLADDFSGIAPDGQAYDRHAAIADVTRVPRAYAAVHLDWIHVRVFGDAAVAQGISSWTRRAGAPRRGRWIWTDTWLRRGERWELVAAEDVEAPPEK
jgi:ketosteroid isomerase-like protein